MSAASNPALSQPESFGKRLHHLAVGALFALVLLIPKILHIRRNPRSWMLFRIFLGVAGAALVVLPVGLGTSFVPAIVGLAMFVVVNGGRFQLANARSAAVQLFVGAESVSVLDRHFQQLLEIPVSEITAACAEESEESWRLRMAWANQSVDFSYGGIFAEHLARVAETTIRSVMRPALPVLPQRRAAGA